MCNKFPNFSVYSTEITVFILAKIDLKRLCMFSKFFLKQDMFVEIIHTIDLYLHRFCPSFLLQLLLQKNEYRSFRLWLEHTSVVLHNLQIFLMLKLAQSTFTPFPTYSNSHLVDNYKNYLKFHFLSV